MDCRDRNEIQWAVEVFRQAARDADNAEDRRYNLIVADALDWSLGNEPPKFVYVIHQARSILAAIKADQN